MEPCNADIEASSQTLSDKNLMKVMIMMSRCGIVTHKSYYEALEEMGNSVVIIMMNYYYYYEMKSIIAVNRLNGYG